MKNIFKTARVLLATFVISAALLGSTQGSALAAAPITLPYQGQLWGSNGQTLTGTYDFRFSLWDTSTGGDASVAVGGNLLWKQEYVGTTVSRSIYEVVLGSGGNPLPDISAGGIYLQVEIKSGGAYETLKDGSGNLPALAAVPFALNANKVGGRAATEFGLLSAAESVSGIWDFVSGFQIGGVAVTATAAQLNQLVNVVASSAGVADAGKLVKLDANGKLDNSLISTDFGSQDIITTGGLTVGGNIAIGADSPTAQKTVTINGGYDSANGGVSIDADGTIRTDGSLVLKGNVSVAGVDFYTGHGQIADTFKVGVGATGSDADYLLVGINGDISDNGGAVTINDADGLTVSQGTVSLPADTIDSAEITDGTIVDADVANISISKLISAVGAYFTYKPNNVACAEGELLRWDNTNGRWDCSPINIIENRTSDPGAPVTGQMWLRTDL
jgi:hypothetical protein